MEQPNIFDYATGELSQDAFICYLLAFGKEEYKKEFPKEYKMAHAFLALCGIEKEEILKIRKQYLKIDVLIETTNHLLIVEDKTGSKEHDDQIVRYVKALKETDLAKGKTIKVCYLKTGDYVCPYKSTDKVLPQSACCSLCRKDMLDLLKKEHSCNLIFESFYRRLDSIEKRIQACDDADINTWIPEKWFDFLCRELKGYGDKFDLDWVSNARGGFYGCWFDWYPVGNGEDYRQIEIFFENGKTSQVKMCFKFSSADKECTRDCKSLIKDLQNKAVQLGYNPSNRKGRTTTYAYKNAATKSDVQAFIKPRQK